ncbi:MAG: GTP cyclohydrolase FolE2 [Heliobacteriaceae bacterium]|jgi:GTP cyclohydrolase I|nr:GTP cyclohydrolase FolE2 [Heliobacteriaceae bacterium]
MKDIQNQKDTREIDIQKVGIKRLELPLIIQRKNNSDQIVCARARVSVSLPGHYKGTHMSRFVEVLNDWTAKNLLGIDIKGCLKDIIRTLEAQSGELEFKFKYFIEKKSPVTGLAAPMSYECSFRGELDGDDYKFILGTAVPVTTLCPCSKEISENGAHNQRAYVKVNVSYDEHVWLEDLIELIESCASCPVYPLLKREDEKYVTERAWENPKFVEDVLRDAVLKLRAHPLIQEFEVECEAFESIHNHSAWAYQAESR